MKLEELVPPLEMCKKIPAGEFEDSLFVYCVGKIQGGGFTSAIILREDISCDETEKYPAPTLEEILQRLKIDVLCGIEHHGDMFVSNRHIGCFEDRSGATAALKLWLKLKGIEK